jgi:DMSO reductase family type II enzyme heme b subunit
VRAVKLQLATKTLLNPGAAQWSKVPLEELRMSGTPVHLQPSRYVRTVWAGKPVGAVRFLRVQAAHNAKDIFFRLEWADETRNADYGSDNVFPDAAAVLFPLNGDAPLDRMGAPGAPINAWYWRANLPSETGQNLVMEGLATEEETQGHYIQTQAVWEEGRWRLVVARPLDTGSGQTVRLGAGKLASVGFAVWEGSSQERGSLHSYSGQWRELDIE